MDKAKGHHHHHRHHSHGQVPHHHPEPPNEHEEDHGNTGNNTACTSGGRYGTVSFQANNSLDIFHVLEMRPEDEVISDEELIKVKDLQFDSDKPWVTGHVPKIIPVNVEGDTTVIHALIKAECFSDRYTLRIYLEYEDAEELIEDNDTTESSGNDCILEPLEIHL